MSKEERAKCAYCTLATAGKQPSYIINNDYVAAFMEPNPVGAGSVIVTTKTHYQDIDELDEATAMAVMRALQAVTRAIKRVYEPDGVGMIQNSGKFSDSLHFHIHVFPRYRNDWFKGLAMEFTGSANADSDEIAAELRQALD